MRSIVTVSELQIRRGNRDKFITSERKYTLLHLIRTLSMRQFYWQITQYFLWKNKENYPFIIPVTPYLELCGFCCSSLILFCTYDTNIHTLMCLNIGTPKNNKFSFVPNGKFIIFRCPKI